MTARSPGAQPHTATRCARAAAIAREGFGCEGEVTPLPGEFDLNFRVSCPRQDIVLKLSPLARQPVFDLVAACLRHLDGARLPAAIPGLVAPAGSPQSPTAEVDFEGAPYIASALTFVPGIPLAELRPRSMPVLSALGALLAELDLALDGFDHPQLDRDFPWRMDSAPEIIRARLDDLATGRDLVTATLDRALHRLDPVRAALPACVIHNDANDYNVMVVPSLQGARLSGLIDFGDVVRSTRAAEVAVAATYAMMGMADPFEAVSAIARGYSSVASLGAEECRAIIPMVALRLCLSVCVQAREIARQPDNAYLAVSQGGAWQLLETLRAADWRLAEFGIREACGLSPNPAAEAVVSWLSSPTPRSPVMSPEQASRPHTLDLSVGSLDLPHPLADLDGWVTDEIARAEATVGVGRYGEARVLYDDPAFHSPGNNGPEARTVHLGIDIFAAPGTPILSPLDGAVAWVADNSAPRDYGPTVILRHSTPDGVGFHTLYGHLDHATLQHLTPGQALRAGDVLGWLGDASVNGGWPPHLHLQVIALDPLYDPGAADTHRGNFPGVALQRLRQVWASVLPDPSAIAGLPASAVTAVRPGDEPVLRKRRLTAKRKTVLGSSLTLSYDDPVHMVRGIGPYLYDDAGRAYLDTVNNVPHVGHANARVADAIARQSRVLNTNTRYLHGEIVALADELLARFPAPLEVVFLVCSGSEANELALRMARCHTGRDGVVCLEGGYHGNTGGLVEVSQYKFDGLGGAGAGPRVAVAPMPDAYRGRFRRGRETSDAELGTRYADEVRRAALRLADDPGVAAFIAEPILSCGGQIEPPPGYLEAAFAHIRRMGGVCIADEVQVGFGRVGDAFWGFELQGVIPDIVTLGKPIGNGHPVAAVVTSRDIARSFANGMEYFSTFGGNPVSCAAARAVLAEIRDLGLQDHARRVGNMLLRELRALAHRYPIVGDVRGRGLFLGMEFVRDPATRDPFPEACAYLINRARERGVLLSVDGPGHNVIKIKPPLVFGDDEAALLVATLDTVLGETALQG